MLPNANSKHLYFDKQLENANATVLLSITGINQSVTNFQSKNYFAPSSDNKPLIFFLNGGVSLSSSNNYEAPLENAFKELSKLTGYLQLAKSVDSSVVQDILKYVPNLQVRTELQTQLVWISSERKSYTLPVFFVRWKREQSIIDYIRTLEVATSPEIKNSGSLLDEVVQFAPGGYRLNEKGLPGDGGNCAIRIGQWFEANNFSLISHNFNIPQETDPEGEPLYMEGTITIKAQRVFDGNTVKEWYKKRTS